MTVLLRRSCIAARCPKASARWPGWLFTGSMATSTAIALSMLTKSEELMHGDVIIKWKSGQASALDQGEIAKGRDVGSITVQKKDSDGQYEGHSLRCDICLRCRGV